MRNAIRPVPACVWLLGWLLAWSAIATSTELPRTEPTCQGTTPGARQLYWGDLHVHTAYSLDAWVFGNRHNPGDAYAFARGQALTLADGKTRVQLARPLDFAAVTDHAETFDVMYLCTDPLYQENNYCRGLLKGSDGSNLSSSLKLFSDYLLTLLDAKPPKPPPLCTQNNESCESAARQQWERTQDFANKANAPCEFSAFIANEWSATPDSQHWHRNLIYASEATTASAIDYIRYPSLENLWEALETQCKPRQGCDVIAIPHNTNMANGGGFSIASEQAAAQRLRNKYERLLEIHQIKGNSECLPAYGKSGKDDCDFEVLSTTKLPFDQTTPKSTHEQQRASYARSILNRGIQSQASAHATKVNSLQLGFIGSTDNHVATPGAVAEDSWKGDTRSWGDSAAYRLERPEYNPGGLVAVWAEQNTRRSLFAALKRREVYATSGPRISLKFEVDWNQGGDSCSVGAQSRPVAVMGGELAAVKSGKPRFTIMAAMDEVRLARVDIVKARVENGIAVQSVIPVFNEPRGRTDICISWRDEEFKQDQHAYWYARVLEAPTPRWSRWDCEKANSCAEHPETNKMIQERAWASPIWYVP